VDAPASEGAAQVTSADSTQDSLPILIFHSLDDRGTVISFAAQAFGHNMARLHVRGYRTLSLLDAADRVRQGRPFPTRSLVLTFDDGYETVYHEALPVLQRYGMSATIFITTGQNAPAGLADRLPSCEGQAMLSWRQILELRRCGVEIGAHTCTHPDLTRLPPAEIRAEIGASKAIIEDMLGAAVRSFAYPFGRYDRRSQDIAREHFACACSDVLALVTPRSDPHALERVDAYYLRPDGLFRVMLTRFLPCYVRTRRITRGVKRTLLARIS
jgi:peptidoglycan/xylan/chitin deacetylase (PgdA/CDA1 family)